MASQFAAASLAKPESDLLPTHNRQRKLDPQDGRVRFRSKEVVLVLTIIRPIVLLFLSPTRLVVELIRNRSEDADYRGKILRRASWSFFVIEALMFVWLVRQEALVPARIQYWHWLLLYYVFSRTVEILIAFGFDTNRELAGKPASSNLMPTDRIHMALKSYLGLIVLFALVYFFSIEGFKAPLDGWEALYFSGVTITTLGYGDIKPTEWYTQACVLVQVLLGLFLLVIAIASYFNSSEDSERLKKLEKLLEKIEQDRE